jgi:hypothetical protein
MPKRRKIQRFTAALSYDGQPVPAELGVEALRKRLLPILIRDAMPTWFEIEGEPDARKRKENERARDRARAELMRMYRKARDHGKLQKLDPMVRHLCENLIAHEPDAAAKAMRARTGAPDQSARRMEIAVAVAFEIEARGGPHGAVEAALHTVADRLGYEYQRVRKIYYNSDSAWRLAVKASVAMRKQGERARIDPDFADHLCQQFEEFMAGIHTLGRNSVLTGKLKPE